MEIQARNVNDALAEGLRQLFLHGYPEKSRNGPVLVAPGPVTTIYVRPLERVLFSPTRDANPFFHLMEALWMLAGRNDVAWPVQFNSRFKEYSDDGKTFSGAYGFRWRRYFGRDQIELVINELKVNPTSRRAVLEMWSQNDLGMPGKDLPCNTHCYFDCRGGVLNMTVCNRSNDALWGAYGANAVHFSVLQEYIAFGIGVPVGTYRQFSNNLHIYTDILTREKADAIYDEALDDRYAGKVAPYPLVKWGLREWDTDLSKFLAKPGDPEVEYKEPFFKEVARPMFLAWDTRKTDKWAGWCYMVAADDWRIAAMEWLRRRQK
jgi:hypothetical protein